MKTNKVTFKNPVQVLQVFYHIHQYSKEQKEAVDVKKGLKEKNIISQSGYTHGEALYLPEQIQTNPLFGNSSFITLEDHASNTNLPQSVFYPQPPIQNRLFQASQKHSLFIFNLHPTHPPALYLEYGDFEVGLPRRESFQICTLRENEAVEVRINGKNDFSLTGRRQRTYKEQVFVMVYLGRFSTCMLVPQSEVEREKQLPQERKIIDLRKPLW